MGLHDFNSLCLCCKFSFISAFPCFTHVSEWHFMLCKEKWKLYIEWSHFIVFNSKLFLIAFYVVTPEPAIWLELLARSVLLLITNIIFIFVQLFFRHYSSFSSRKLYAYQVNFICLLHLFWLSAFKGETNNYRYYRVRLRCSTSTVDFVAKQQRKKMKYDWLSI